MRPTAPTPQATPVAPAGQTAATTGRPVGAHAASTTVISSSLSIKGSLKSSENVDLLGEFEGQIDVQARLFVGPEAKATANLKVAELILAGTVQGNVTATDRVSLRTGANLVGDVKTPGIVIEDGAFFKGGIDIIRAEAGAKAAPAKSGA